LGQQTRNPHLPSVLQLRHQPFQAKQKVMAQSWCTPLTPLIAQGTFWEDALRYLYLLHLKIVMFFLRPFVRERQQ